MQTLAPECSSADESSLPAHRAQALRGRNAASDHQQDTVTVIALMLTLQCVRNSCSCCFRFSFIVTRALSLSSSLFNKETFDQKVTDRWKETHFVTSCVLVQLSLKLPQLIQTLALNISWLRQKQYGLNSDQSLEKEKFILHTNGAAGSTSVFVMC